MGFRILALAYVLGGVTFLPLLALAVLLPTWFWLAKHEEHDQSPDDGGGDSEAYRNSVKKEAADLYQREDGQRTEESGASGVYAVLRTYDFALANAALAYKNSGSGNAGSGAGSGDSNASAEFSSQSDSVYQTMYRSVFDRGNKSKDVNSLRNSEDDGTGNESSGGRTKGKYNASKNLFYIVLRHGHLMLYSSSAQVEVKHVISLAHHAVSLSEGEESEPGRAVQLDLMQESDLFVKRSAILLTPINAPHIRRVSSPRPFYLFSANCSDKEDFYHSLLAAQSQAPTPLALQPEHLIKLQTNLHATTLSMNLTPETRALDALIGRLFLALYRTDFLRNHIRAKIERKIARVQKPAFIESIVCESVDLGDSAPVVSNLRLRDLNINGDMILAADVRYTGNFKLTLAALAKIDLGLGQRFKPRTVPLLLAGILKKLQGHVLLKMKPPPSNRLWVCFEQAPEMEVKIEPVVGVKQISYGFILRAIEGKIREVVAETLVKPNWDDAPFFDSSSQDIRGGIWKTGQSEDGAESKVDAIASASDPALAAATVANNLTSSAASSSTDLGSTASTPLSAAQQASNNSVKRRSVASLPADHQIRSSTQETRTRPVRSPSFAAASPSAPSVALDDVSAESVRGEDVQQQPKRWRTWAASGGTAQAKKDAREAIRDLRDRATREPADNSTNDPQLSKLVEALQEQELADGEDDEGQEATTLKPFGSDSRKISDEVNSTSSSDVTRAPSTDTEATSALDDVDFQTLWQSGKMSMNTSTSSQGRSTRSQTTSSNAQPNTNARAKSLIAATAAATNAAKAWYVNRKSPQSGTSSTFSKSPPNAPGANSDSASNSSNTEGPSGSTISKASRVSHQRRTSSLTGQPLPDGPIGRGQPLPPPGTPLPGPEKERSAWSLNGVGGAAAGLIAGAGAGNLRRKPVLPARTTRMTTDSALPFNGLKESTTIDVPTDSKDAAIKNRISGEFGPWAENAGEQDTDFAAEDTTSPAFSESSDSNEEIVNDHDPSTLRRSEKVEKDIRDGQKLEKTDTAIQRKKTPPPLPNRPASINHGSSDAPATNQMSSASRRTSGSETLLRSSKSQASATQKDRSNSTSENVAYGNDVDEVLNIPAPSIVDSEIDAGEKQV